jgi:cell division septation protein DedD
VDSTLKQRLLGAGILVALIVIVVPEFLRGKAPPPGDPTLLPRASKETDANAPLRSVTVDMRESAAVPPPAGSPAGAPMQPPGPASAASAIPVPAAAPDGAPEPESPMAGPAAPAVVPAPAVTPASSPASAKLPKPVANGPWVVQLGSFALKVSAERLARELKADGYPAYVSPVQRGARELFRVRVGPLGDRQAASAYFKTLRAAGKDVAIVPNQ